MQAVEARHASRQDTFDLRDQITTDDHSHHAHDLTYTSDEEHSVLEDDSDGEERDEYMEDDDASSSLSIPDEAINFDMVYALHSFAATVEGQANVVKGDSLFLMDDSNSYWWLIRVLKTQEVGYIPAENIETPFERLARLNKHRNVDLASATQAERLEAENRLLASRAASSQATPSPTPGAARSGSRQGRNVNFTAALSVHRYPPAVWGDDEEEEEDVEWDDEGYEDEDPDIAEDLEQERRQKMTENGGVSPLSMEPDDGMSWEDGAVESIQARSQQGRVQAQVVITSSSSEFSVEEQDASYRQPQQQKPIARDPFADGQTRTTGATVSEPTVLRSQSSRERLAAAQNGATSGSPTSPNGIKVMDPAQAIETRKVSLTPQVARSADDHQQPAPASGGPLLPSAIMQQQHEERKRTREEIEALEEAQRKKANKGTSRSSISTPDSKASPGKLRKERDRGDVTTEDESGRGGKKKGGVFSLFRKKEKGKEKEKGVSGGVSENGSIISAGSSDNLTGRNSGESGRSSSQHTHTAESTSPVTASARQQQQQAMQQQQSQKNSADPRRLQQGQQQPQTAATIPISQHASQLRQRDEQQQALYKQYLNRSPASPPEAQPSYGLQSAPLVMPGSMSFSSASSTSGLTVGSRPRPGSLVLSPGAMDGQGVGLPDLSVIRVFAGNNVQTEATFKTVLLNASTTASDLVRQAIQRFRLPAGEDESEYYLTIKQVEGSSAKLLPQEKPLGVFESLVEAALELPKVKRSSVGSISSVASNLSMHPAIKKLSMNDFTDDSAVKFYLNRKGGENENSPSDDENDETLLAESFADSDSEPPRSPGQFLSVNTGGAGVTPERFSSPSYRFALQLIIHPEDLPDDMVFDPLTEAIVFKHTLRDRHSSVSTSSDISQTQRRKVFVFPKNVTVAEVIELGLERFGIIDGVVDGGDEVEDKMTKRRSSTRVRYGLYMDTGGREEKELSPASKVIDAFSRPPTYRVNDRRDTKRRSVDSAQLLLGNAEDIGPDDPLFVLRRAISYRPSSRHRSSAPLDEIALQKLHRESLSGSSVMSDSTISGHDESKRQMTKQERIVAQRIATRANQRAILSAEDNAARGLDVLLPGNAMIRSSRYEVDDRMRYSYVEPDGETYDISDIVEAEWRNEGPNRERAGSARDDLLHGVLSRGKDGLGAKLDRVLSKIKHEKGNNRSQAYQSPSSNNFDSHDPVRNTTPSVYSTAEGRADSRSDTPNAHILNARSPTPTSGYVAGQRATSPVSRLSSYRTASPGESEPRSRSGTVTPSGAQRVIRPPHDRQQSLASVISESSAYRTPSPNTPPTARFNPQAKNNNRQRLVIPKNDFGISEMMAVIETRGMLRKRSQLPPLDAVDELLFGREIDMNSLHPQIKEIYSDTFKQLAEMDNALDDLLHHVAHAF
ncbi:hypothetical protein EW026_g3614 [Hermanssonia centrifuga]|uniref:SH3 domain-containing protein n=1 Tax=Hermanssonia centrifuga TaxID=98765 RepID=A0A4S4KK54_9APHY|nr:hypothetical protein EW026_g3614 [Hermanssonia centrifuga]